MSISAHRRPQSLVVAAAALAFVVAPMSAHAAGSKTSCDVALGPTQLATTVRSSDGRVMGHLPIPQTSAAFKVAGFLPAKAKVEFVEAAPAKGHLRRKGNRTFVISHALNYARLSDLTLGGLPTFVGDSCKTAEPIRVPASTPQGETFDLTTAIIDLIVPGSGNTLDLTVSNGRVG